MVEMSPGGGQRGPALHYDLELRNRVFRDTTVEHDWDAAPPVGAILRYAGGL